MPRIPKIFVITVLKFDTNFLFPFLIYKMSVFRAGIHKMLVRNKQTGKTDHTAFLLYH